MNGIELDSSPIDAFIIGNRAREHFDKIVNNINNNQDIDDDDKIDCSNNNIDDKPIKSSSSTPNKNRKTPTKVIQPRDIAELSKLLSKLLFSISTFQIIILHIYKLSILSGDLIN